MLGSCWLAMTFQVIAYLSLKKKHYALQRERSCRSRLTLGQVLRMVQNKDAPF